jgi:F-type H+-transporting ATPase subunit epsilon
MIQFSITTPERNLLNEEVDSLTLPTQFGEITILKNHIPLVANLVPGEIKYRKGEEESFFSVSGGFIEVKKGNKVTVLADTAEFGHEIDIDRAEKAREDARKMMHESYKDEKNFADAAAILEKNLARLKVARKHRTKTHKNLGSGKL